ncbi:MAG: CdaR family protein [Desulfobulbaceae bacterium]|nr:CdaR family protein [Desulfobulbaceae bacterium]HIJ78049.1 YbbR-like domain-containing protein [Deltaproteobacteria bacterium]
MEKLVKQVLRRAPNANIINWPQNWVLKLLSLFFAVFLWFFVVGEDKVDTNVIIPVEIVNLPRDLVVSNQFKKQLEVTISGPRGLINGVNRQHISRTINLSKADPGTVVVKNETDSIPFPRGINVLRIQPNNITLLLDRLIEKEFVITAKTTGKPDNNFELKNVKLTPRSLKINGPQSIIGKDDSFNTKPIDITDRTKSFDTQISLDLEPEILNLIGDTVVDAEVVIQEKMVEKAINNIPVQIMSKEAQALVRKISPNKVNILATIPITISEDKAKLQDLIQTRIWADNLSDGQHTIQVETAAPNHVKIIEIIPAEVTVTIGKRKK